MSVPATPEGRPVAWWDEVATDDGPVELRVRQLESGVRLVVTTAAGEADVVLPPGAVEQLAQALSAAVGVVPGGSTPERPGGPGPSAPAAAPAAAAATVAPWDEPPPSPQESAEAIDRLLVHLRRLAEVLPDTVEIHTLGLPTFRVATRIFAVVETVEDVPVLRFKVPLDEQAALLDDPRFRPDPDTGHHGWTNLRADRVAHSGELDQLLLGSYRLVAPADTIVRLDAALGSVAGGDRTVGDTGAVEDER